VAIGLPWLEIMEPRKALAAAGGARRYFVGYCGTSIAGDADSLTKNPGTFIPDTEGPNYDLKAALEPLGTTGAKPYVSVVSGIRMDFLSFHGGAQSPLLTGVLDKPIPGTQTADIMGTSSDQIVSDAMAGNGLKYKHLPLKVQPSFYGLYRPSGDTICFRMEGGAKAKSLGMQTSPKAAYDSLFSGFTPSGGTGMPDPAQLKASDLAWRKRKTLLDLVRDSTQRARMRLGAIDKQRLDRHLTEINELGRQIAVPPKVVATAACNKPDAFGGDPPQTAGLNSSNEELRAKLMSDLMYMAFACDQTRVGTLMFTNVQCNLSGVDLPGVGYKASLHDASHFLADGNTNRALGKAIAWHMKHFGTLVKKLADTPDAGGTLIDTAAMVFMFEGGVGPVSPGSVKVTAHSGENMACLIAGKAGGLKAGQHIVAKGAHPANVLISAMNAVGVPTERLGAVVGEIPGLRG
jgi:hypothetical protein